MSNIKPVVLDVSVRGPGGQGDGSALMVIWGATANPLVLVPFLTGDVLLPVSFPKHGDRSIQFAGTPGAAGTLTLLGSNDDTNFIALHDTAGVAISITSNGIKQILENCVQTKPVFSGGDGTTSMVVSMLFHFSNAARQ